MAKYKSSRNVVQALRIVRSLHGAVTGIGAVGKHFRMTVVTPQGNRFVATLSKSAVEPYKLKGWLRQEFNKADAKGKK